MRSIPLLAATTVILFGVGACGDGGDTGTNEDPVAGFTVAQPCTVGVACAFTDASSDPEGANTITTRSWDFNGDNIEDLGGNQTAPTFMYSAAGVFQAKLTVTDNGENTDDVIVPVTVNAGTPGNLPPTASFDLPPSCTAGTPCGFHSTSTDDVAILTTAWEFGDGGTAQGTDATHTFAAAGPYNVKLTVTDDQGLTGTVTQSLTVTAPTSTDCTTSTNQSGGRIVNCNLVMTQRSTVTLKIVSRSCELGGNSLGITTPRSYIPFPNLCFRSVGEEHTITGSDGLPLVFEAGSTLGLRFNQGTADAGDPATGDPGIEISGGAPSWTLNIDDGGAAGTEGEPDFDDAVISVTATAAP
jgi:PKD repeat protein